jgi:hypothetical protein
MHRPGGLALTEQRRAPGRLHQRPGCCEPFERALRHTGDQGKAAHPVEDRRLYHDAQLGDRAPPR